MIKDSSYCAAEVQRHCSKKVAKNDYLVINCFDLAVSNGKVVDPDCEHFLWIWKKAQTESALHQQVAVQKCPKEVAEDVAKECVKNYDMELGADNKLIPCLMDFRKCFILFNTLFKVIFRKF